MTEPELKKAILNKLMFVKSMSYGLLHKEIGNHDLFNYHLRELVAKELVIKKGSVYSLSEKGRQQVALMEEDGQYQKQFKVGTFMNLLRFYKGKWQMLLHRRLKHPHYGYIGTVTAKMKWGDSAESNLFRELKEELEIVPTKYDLVGIHRTIFRNEQNEKVGDSVCFVFIVTKWEGIPAEKSVEGEYFWHDLDDILNLDKIFRKGFEIGIPHMKKYLENPEKFVPYIVEEGGEMLQY